MAIRVAIIRFVGVLVLLPMLFVALPIVGPYSDWVASSARWYAYNFEAEQFSHCRMSPGERIAYISDEYVVRVSRKEEGYDFAMGTCDSPLTRSSDQQ